MRQYTLLLFTLFLFASLFLSSCGALFTELPGETDVLEGPIEGLTGAQRKIFIDGDEGFGEKFTASSGLGPVFNQGSCDTCHVGDGKGHPSTNLTRFGVGNSNDASQFNYLLEAGGPQLQNHAVPGYVAESLDSIRAYVTKRWPEKKLALSVRSAPIVVGLGLIEHIPDATILQYADPDDKDGDGISGRPNYVSPPSYFEPVIQHKTQDGKVMGRFGRKATSINLLHQVVNAYINDMGVTTEFEPRDVYNPLVGNASGDSAPEPEVSTGVVRNVVFYMQTLRAPARRDLDNPDVAKGEALFKKSMCAKCHVPTMKTGDSKVAALSNKEVHLYSDMLLHDMGPKLADHYPEGAATGREWRTTPLWGLGAISSGLGGKEYYLHDGRATSLEQAILLHGGEAQASRDMFSKLSDEEKKQLLTFLRSL